jgi:hypothetical protein
VRREAYSAEFSRSGVLEDGCGVSEDHGVRRGAYRGGVSRGPEFSRTVAEFPRTMVCVEKDARRVRRRSIAAVVCVEEDRRGVRRRWIAACCVAIESNRNIPIQHNRRSHDSLSMVLFLNLFALETISFSSVCALMEPKRIRCGVATPIFTCVCLFVCLSRSVCSSVQILKLIRRCKANF